MRHRPGDGGDQRRDDEQKDARRRAARRAHPRELRSRPPAERPLGEMPDRLAPERVAGLHRERVQRPEIRLGEPEQRAPAVDRDRRRGDHDDHRADLGRLVEAVRRLADPRRQDQRREAEQNRGREDLDRPGDGELGQADLAEQASGDREQRALLGRRVIALEIAETRIDQRRGSGRCRRRSSGRQRSNPSRRALAGGSPGIAGGAASR